MELPVIELTIDDIDLDRVEMIALVDTPAIMRNWMAFNSQENVRFKAVDSEKRIIAGALMIPDFNIFRVKDDKQFFVRFSRETIEAIVNKFMKEGRSSSFNYMHDENVPLSDIYIQQSFIIDSEKGMNTPEGMETLPNGTWFGYIKVDNDEIWNDFVKTGKLKGFSVEGNFSQKENFNSNIMNKIEQMLERLEKKFFSSEEAQKEFGSAKLTDGTEITWEGELTEGTPIMLADGSPAPDGDHTLEDGSIVTIAGGIVTAIAKPEEAPSMEDMSAEMKSEIEALKLSVAELKTAIESNKPQDFSSDIASLKETQKELFETIKAFNESKDSSSKANNFKKAEVKISNKIDAMAERFSREGNLN
jgi:hypothetical protein